MYRKYPVTMKKEGESKALEILIDLLKARDVDSWYFSRVDENTVDCYVAPILSEELEMIKNKFREAGIQLI